MAAPLLNGSFGFNFWKQVGPYRFLTQPRLLSADQPEAHVLRWILETLPKGGTFFDVGAHFGWLSMIAARHAGESATIVAFEPSPILSRIADFHKKVNRLDRIQLIDKVVSGTIGEKTPFFLINDGLSYRNSLMIGADSVPYVAADKKKRIEVPSITIDSYVDSTGLIPDLIKIDVEGAEGLVLQGAQRLLAVHHPDIILGVHPYWLPETDSVTRILQFLSNLQYQITDEFVVEFDGTYLADYLLTWSRKKK